MCAGDEKRGGASVAKRWSGGAVVCAVLLTLCLSAFLVDRVDSTARMAAETLGYAGEGVRVTAVPDGAAASATDLSSTLLDYASRRGVSIAYTRWYESGVVTLYDPRERFRSSTGPLWPLLERSDDSLGLAVAESMQGSKSTLAEVLGAGQAYRASAFRADVMFEGRYPVALLAPEQDSFDLGIYFIAGAGLDIQEIAQLFGEHGLSVVEASSRPSVSVAATLWSAMASLYGAISSFFWLILVGAVGFALRLLAATRRPAYEITKALGATRRDVIGLVARDILPSVLVGLLVGAAVSLLLVWSTTGLSTAGTSLRVLASCAAVVTSFVLCAALLILVAYLEARRGVRANLL